MEAKENKVVLRRAELKNMIKELIKEIVASGELNEILQSAGVNGQQLLGSNSNKYGLDNNTNTVISALASAVAGNDPSKKSVLEAIFADTAKTTNPQQLRMEMNSPNQTFFNQGVGHPAFTAVTSPQIGYIGNNSTNYYSQPQGFIPYGGSGIPQTPQTPQIFPQQIPQQQQQMHPLAKIAFRHPLKNTLDNS
jgi:hypothetical protein